MSPINSWPNSAAVGMPKISGMFYFIEKRGPRFRGGNVSALFHQRAAALFLRPERLVGRDGGAQLVVVVRVLRLRRLLHLEEVRGVDLAAVLADLALAEEWIVGRQLLHLR